MNIFLDSFSVLMGHWRLIGGTLLILFLGQILVWSVLKMIFSDELASDEYYSLSISGWALPIFLAAVLWLLLRFFQAQALSSNLIVFSLIALLAIILFLRIRKGLLQDSKTMLFILFVLFGLFIFLRLAFVSKAAIPLYFDSAQHYLIIKNILGNLASSATTLFSWPPTGYYHIGFHIVAAFIASTLHADIISIMLILGQMILAVIPLSVFFLIRHETRSRRAGIFAVLLAAFGWYMPAHAVDWGKYPALTSLALITFAMSLAYLSIQHRRTLSSGKYLSLNGILLSAIAISGLTHSRSLVIFGIVILAWIIATLWQKLPKLSQMIFFSAVILGIIVEIILIRAKDVFGPLFDPYIHKGMLITGMVLFLSIFAQWVYPKLAFSIILAIFLLFGSLFIPVQGIPGYIDLTLLDRPFVEMIFYLPLSLLGGLGLAGLGQYLHTKQAKTGNATFLWAKYIGVFFIAVLLINALSNYEVYPSGCCSIVGRDDLVALDWMDKNLPAQARILISSTELRVLATDSFQGSAGADAGTWINPLTSRATFPLPYFSDFSQQTTLDALCNMQVNYIYVGETGLTFDDTKIAPHRDWYKNLLSMPKVKVYEVIGCN
jgi:hypothetical protein